MESKARIKCISAPPEDDGHTAEECVGGRRYHIFSGTGTAHGPSSTADAADGSTIAAQCAASATSDPLHQMCQGELLQSAELDEMEAMGRALLREVLPHSEGSRQGL